MTRTLKMSLCHYYGLLDRLNVHFCKENVFIYAHGSHGHGKTGQIHACFYGQYAYLNKLI